jgi:hypothetical protein
MAAAPRFRAQGTNYHSRSLNNSSYISGDLCLTSECCACFNRHYIIVSKVSINIAALKSINSKHVDEVHAYATEACTNAGVGWSLGQVEVSAI